jgi:Domain of unknown function (DUF222)/HNH endonuclease
MADSASFTDRSALELADAIGQLGSALSAIHSQLLALVALADGRGDWREDGATSMAGWLCARLGLRSANAAEWVRVAHALESLPECASAFAEGRLAWDQVRPLTEFATPERDAEQASDACGSSASFLEVQARRARRVSRIEAETQERRKFLRMWQSDREGFRLAGRLPVVDGAKVAAALNRIADEGNPSEPLTDRLADALTQLSSARLAEDPDPDRACVVVHVEATALTGEAEGSAQVDGEHPVAIEVAQRLACDSRLELVAEGPDGVPVGIGRASRTIPAWLWRQIKYRDGGQCRFPGCRHRRWLHGHHIEWWSRGGRTDLDGICSLCPHCHKLVHELGWRVSGNANGVLTFTSPTGQVLTTGLPGLRPDVRADLDKALGLAS